MGRNPRNRTSAVTARERLSTWEQYFKKHLEEKQNLAVVYNCEISSLHLSLGDKVIVKVPLDVSEDFLCHLKEELKIAFPDNKVILFHGDFNLSIIKEQQEDEK